MDCDNFSAKEKGFIWMLNVIIKLKKNILTSMALPSIT